MGLTWVEDESNQDLRFDRNFIRHQVTPTLTERWHSFRESVSRSAQLCAEQELLLDELLESHLQQALTEKHSLSIKALSQHSDLLRARLLRMWLSRCNQPMPSQKQLKLIWDEVACAQADANPKLVLNEVEVRRFNHQLYIVKSIFRSLCRYRYDCSTTRLYGCPCLPIYSTAVRRHAPGHLRAAL